MVSREKQLKRLKKDAQQLWYDQQELLNRANDVAHVAWPYAAAYAKDRVGPTATTLYEERLRPVVGRGAVAGAAASKVAAGAAKEAVVGTVVPALTSAAAAALTLADQATDRLGHAGDTAKVAATFLSGATKLSQKAEAKNAAKVAAAAAAAKKAAKASRSGGLGIGGTIGVLLGIAALAGIAYAIWQTLRADDDLWVADDEPETNEPTTPAA